MLELDARGEMVRAQVFFNQVVSLVRDGFIENGDTVRMDVRCVDVELNPKDAFACGLIINELLSNSLKHAFPENRKGEIKIEIRSANETAIHSTDSTEPVNSRNKYN